LFPEFIGSVFLTRKVYNAIKRFVSLPYSLDNGGGRHAAIRNEDRLERIYIYKRVSE